MAASLPSTAALTSAEVARAWARLVPFQVLGRPGSFTQLTLTAVSDFLPNLLFGSVEVFPPPRSYKAVAWSGVGDRALAKARPSLEAKAFGPQPGSIMV